MNNVYTDLSEDTIQPKTNRETKYKTAWEKIGNNIFIKRTDISIQKCAHLFTPDARASGKYADLYRNFTLRKCQLVLQGGTVQDFIRLSEEIGKEAGIAGTEAYSNYAKKLPCNRELIALHFNYLTQLNHTKEAVARDVQACALWFLLCGKLDMDPGEVTFADISWAAMLRQSSYNQAVRTLSAVKRYFTVMYSLGRIRVNPLLNAKFNRRQFTFEQLRSSVKKAIPLAVHNQILAASDEKHKVIFEFFWQTGFSVSDMAMLNVSQLDTKSCVVLGYRRKTGVMMDCVITRELMDSLLDRYEKHGDKSTGAIWPEYHERVHSERKLAGPSAYFERALKRAKVEEHYSLHDYRRSVAYNVLHKNKGLVEAAKMLGHSSVDTTAAFYVPKDCLKGELSADNTREFSAFAEIKEAYDRQDKEYIGAIRGSGDGESGTFVARLDQAQDTGGVQCYTFGCS